MRKSRGILAAGALALLTVPALARAQDRQFIFTPYIAFYAPTAKIATGGFSGSGTAATADIKHKDAFALGVTGSYWFNKRTGIELGGAYAYSDAKGSVFVNGSEAGSVTDNARMMFGSAKVMVGLLPTTGNAQLRLGIGPAVINRGGTAYKDVDGKVKGLTDVGAAISLCTRLPITDLVAFRVRAEDYMYNAKIRWVSNVDPSENLNFGRKLQNDLLFSLGFQIGYRR